MVLSYSVTVIFTERIILNRGRVKVSDTVFVTQKVTGKPGANYTIDADNDVSPGRWCYLPYSIPYFLME